MTTTNVQLLKRYALNNYELGGRWVAECWDTVRYVEVLEDCKDDLEEAKRQLRSYWSYIQREEDQRNWSIPSDDEG